MTVSDSAGHDYGALFDRLLELLEYDRHRLTEQGVRSGRPVIAVIVDSAPPDDAWSDSRLKLTDGGDDAPGTAPVIVAVGTRCDAMNLAEALAFPAGHCALASSPERAGEVAALVVVRALASWGIGNRGEPTGGPNERKY